MRRESSRRRALACLAAAALACSEPPEPPAPVARPVKILAIAGADDPRVVEYPGTISPLVQADMAFEVPGRIVEFRVGEGQQVAKGEVLARLDPRDFEADLAKWDANLRKTRTDLERYRILYAKGVSPKIELERAERAHEVSEAEARKAGKALEDAVLRAPFAGVVARKQVEDFANVQAKEVVLILQDVSALKIEVDVPEGDLAAGRTEESLEELNERLRPRVRVSSLGERSFPARLAELTTAADPTTRTFQATLRFDAPADATVLPGMTARVVLDRRPGGGGSALRVPAGAVLEDETGAPFVWKVDPASMAVSRAAVETGALTGDALEIRAGLSPGDQIAVSGVHQLRAGDVVRRFQD